MREVVFMSSNSKHIQRWESELNCLKNVKKIPNLGLK
jgi:hypothetical protein